MFLINGAHGRGSWRDGVVHKEEESLLRAEVDSLPDQEIELAHSQVRRDQVLLLVQVSDLGLWRLLHDHLEQ